MENQFKNKTKIGKPLAKLISESQNKNMNEREITTDTTEVQNIIKEYLCTITCNKFNTPEQMGTFLENLWLHKTTKKYKI